jgi:hypothetical protein
VIDEESSPEKLPAVDEKLVKNYYSDETVRRVEDVIVNATFCFLVLVPIFALSYLQNKVGKLLVVLGFVLVSSVVTTVLANVTHKNSLAIMAA